MKTILWIFVATIASLLAVSCAIGANVAVNGNPTAWGSCK